MPISFEEEADLIGGIGIDADTRSALMDGALTIRTGHGLINYVMGDAGGLAIGLNLGLTYQITHAINADLDTNLFSKPAEGDSTSQPAPNEKPSVVSPSTLVRVTRTVPSSTTISRHPYVRSATTRRSDSPGRAASTSSRFSSRL